MAHYPFSFKLKVVNEVVMSEEEKGAKSRVAAKYGISNYSVSNWVKKYRDQLVPSKKDNNVSCLDVGEEAPIIKEKDENELLKTLIFQKELEIRHLKNQYETIVGGVELLNDHTKSPN